MSALRIVLCAEGARVEMGGVGLVAVPPIARALAARGHHVVLDMFGPPIPGAENFVTTDAARAFQENLVAFSFPARGRYAFSRDGSARVQSHVARADFVMLHSLYSFAVLSGYLGARRFHKSYGVWLHGVLAPFQRSVGRRKKVIYNALFAKSILENASVLFYSAPGERDEAAPLDLRAPSVIIPHGIDLELFTQLPARGAFRQKYLHGFDGPLAVYLGRLNAKKGLDLLVEAMHHARAKNPALRLAIVGAGDPPAFGAQVQTWVRDANLQDVIVMPGLMMGDEKLRALADADIFVLPSIAENFSFALFEAMAARVPVVISDTLNFAPQVQRAGAGRVVARHAHAFAGALSELSLAPDLRREMGERGAQLAARYSWNAVGEQMERVVYAVVENEPLPRDLVLGTTFA
jgi:glycosyltransferase involved in cell wall biosynthesis